MTNKREQIVKIIKVEVCNTCEGCPFAYYGQFCLECKATHPWRNIPVTIEDTKAKYIRPHYIPDWCPFPNKEEQK